MNDVKVWKKQINESLLFSVRAIEEDGEPWFIAKDVADALGYSDASKMYARLDEDETRNRQISGYGNQLNKLINESGLYNAIMGSIKPEAKEFKKWVTSEVLPSIRKTGSYSVAPKTFSEALRLAADKQEEIERQQALIEKQAPLVTLAKAVIAEDRLLAITDAGKEFGFKRDAFFDRLSQLGWIYKRPQYDNVKKENPWLPTSFAMEKGYVVLKERLDAGGRSRLQSMITPEGMVKLSEIFSL